MRVLLIAILHFVADADDPAGVVSALMRRLPGSFLVISHLTADHYTHAGGVEDISTDTTPGLHLRSRSAVEALSAACRCSRRASSPTPGTGTRTRTPTRHGPRADRPIWCGIARKP